ncbi:hypothetical protein Gotur_033901 [Gossypium turneri]
MSNAWNQTRRMKILATGPIMTPEYSQWRDQRVNDNIPAPNPEIARSLEKHMQLGLDMDIQRSEANKLRKGKNKAEEDLDSLKTDYKKLRRSIRTVDLGKTSEQWQQEICQNEKIELKAQITELERSFHQHRSRNSAVELKTSLNKIGELKGQVRELEDALQNSELRIALLERDNEQWQEQFHRSQDQIGERDYVMGEAVVQVREVADHLQTLAVQADLLSLKYESISDRGQKLSWLLRKIKALSIRAKPYT